MLVVVANWGIADGTLVSASRHDQVAWLRAVRRAAIRAGFRRDGRYLPPQRIDVVLAGDTFDLLTSTAWTDAVRPWQRGPRAAAARDRVLAQAAARGGRLLAGLRRWARRGIPLPRANRHGRPAPGTEMPVPAAVAILAGDRDAWLEDAHAVAGRHRIVLGGVWSGSACAASIRHGHEFDPFSCGDGESRHPRDRGPTLAESLAVDLVARFGATLREDATGWPAARPLVAALVAARPAQMAAVFRRWRLRHGGALANVGEQWKAAVDGWWREARRTRPTCAVEYDPVDAVAATLAAADAEDDAGTADPFDLPVGLPTGRGADGHGAAGFLLLGHPPAQGGGHAGPRASLVCLGAPTVAPGPPPTAILTRHGDEVRLDWLGDEPAVAIAAPRPQFSARIVEAA